MKIKQVSKITGLTERTIRFYCEKNLVQPEKSESNGRVYINFAADNVDQLRQIAVLRKMDFTLDDIKFMLLEPDRIGQMVQKHLADLQQKQTEFQETIEALKKIASQDFRSMQELAAGLSQAAEQRRLPQIDIRPNFSRFDPETDEEKNEAYLDFLVSMRLREKREKILQPLKKGFLLLLLLAVISALVVLISGIPRKIDVSYPAIQMRYLGEDSVPVEVEKTNIRIKGKYSNRLLSNPRFSGEIIIASLPHVHDYELIDLEFSNKEQGISAVLVYTAIIEQKPVLDSVGQLITDSKFQQLMIRILEPIGTDRKSTEEGLQLLAPAETKAEAIRIYNELMPKPNNEAND